MSEGRFPKRTAAALAMAVAAVVLLGRVRAYTLSDPQLTLLTAQALWDRGSIDLRPEFDSLGPLRFAKGSWKYARDADGRVLYIYPLGAALFSLPVVAVLRSLGADMAGWETDQRCQIFLAALTCALLFVLLAQIAWLLTGDRAAPFLAFALFLGSSLMSTLGSALWSFNVELLFALLAVREVALTRGEPMSPLRALRIGLFLGTAWVCRPSASILALPMVIHILLRHPRRVLLLVAGLALTVGPFLIFCYAQFGAFLTSYYAPGRWLASSNFGAWPRHLEALLISPARGLFVFTPILLLGIFSPFLKAVRAHPLAWILATWAALTVFVIATQGNWWGGWSFGPRLLSEAVPGLGLLSMLGWRGLSNVGRALLGPILVLCLVWGIFVHTAMGRFSHAAYSWNDRPNIDEAPEFYRLNWRFPQFLATGARNEAKAHGR